MGFEGDLSAKVATLREAALDAYADWIRARSSKDITINDARTTVEAPTLPERYLALEQEEFDRYVVDVDEMVRRF